MKKTTRKLNPADEVKVKLLNNLQADMSAVQTKTRHVRTIIMKAHDDVIQISRSLPDNRIMSLALLQVARVLNEGEQMVKNQEEDLCTVRNDVDKVQKEILKVIKG